MAEASRSGSLPADAIVVAAGSSSRMGGIDKLSAGIGGRTVLDRSVDAFVRSAVVDRIVIVTAPAHVASAPPGQVARPRVAAVVPGGARRQESVARGLGELRRRGLPDDRVVLVHDAARPLVEEPLIERVAEAAALHGAAVPSMPVVDTLKKVAGGRVTGTIDRRTVATVQTPQGVRAGLLLEAYRRFPPHGEPTFTDEAALLEACSIPVHAIEGQAWPENLKITTPIDLVRARAMMPIGPGRVGLGHDSHAFGPGSPLVLGGVTFPGAPRLHGHSDGDVVLHAVADALLGGAAMGDLGRLFPSDLRTPRGVDSADLLVEVVTRLRGAGQAARSVDITIIGARPRLGDRLEAIRDRVAALLAIAVGSVSVKASTGNLDGMEGAGRGISARVIAEVGDEP